MHTPPRRTLTRTSPTRPLTAALAAALALQLFPAPATAAPERATKAAPAKPTKPVGRGAVDASEVAAPLSPDLAERIGSSDEAKAKAALDEVRVAGKAGAQVAPAVVALLRKGATVALTTAAIETLGDVEAESASDVVAWYARHRSPGIRRVAVATLARTKGASAVKALRAALGDSDPAVRSAAASGLGNLRARDAVPDLFVALDHRVNEAAASIGLLCSGADCDKLAARMGELPFDVVTSGIEQMLFRPQAEVSDEQRIRLLGRVREVGTLDANKFLRDIQSRATSFTPRVKQALDQAISATSGATR